MVRVDNSETILGSRIAIKIASTLTTPSENPIPGPILCPSALFSQILADFHAIAPERGEFKAGRLKYLFSDLMCLIQ